MSFLTSRDSPETISFVCNLFLHTRRHSGIVMPVEIMTFVTSCDFWTSRDPQESISLRLTGYNALSEISNDSLE
jgi:hypothetical protein